MTGVRKIMTKFRPDPQTRCMDVQTNATFLSTFMTVLHDGVFPSSCSEARSSRSRVKEASTGSDRHGKPQTDHELEHDVEDTGEAGTSSLEASRDVDRQL